jgi:hypothetical protein
VPSKARLPQALTGICLQLREAGEGGDMILTVLIFFGGLSKLLGWVNSGCVCHGDFSRAVLTKPTLICTHKG